MNSARCRSSCRAATVCTAALLATVVSGCARYIPLPIEPQIVAADFEARSLNDPRLESFLAHFASGKGSNRSWDLTSLTLVSLYYHPELGVSRARLGQAQAAIVTAAQIPNPEFNLASAYNTITSPSPLTVGAIINFLLETSGRRKYRIAQAEHLADAALQDLASASWQVRGRVRFALLNLWAAEVRSRLLTQRQELQGQLVNVLERQFEVGEVAALDVSRERAALGQIRLAAQDVLRQSAEARVQLATALGVPAHALNKVRLSFSAFESPPRNGLSNVIADMRRDALLGRGDLQILLAEYAAAQSALQLELAKRFPNISLGPGYEFDQGNNRYWINLRAELPIFNRNEGQIAEAEGKRIEVAARFNALQAQIIGDIDLAAASYRASIKSMATGDALHAAQKVRRQKVESAFRQGEINRATFLSSEVEFAAIELARFDALIQLRQSIGLLEDAVRRPLFDPGAMPLLQYHGVTPSADSWQTFID